MLATLSHRTSAVYTILPRVNQLGHLTRPSAFNYRSVLTMGVRILSSRKKTNKKKTKCVVAAAEYNTIGIVWNRSKVNIWPDKWKCCQQRKDIWPAIKRDEETAVETCATTIATTSRVCCFFGLLLFECFDVAGNGLHLHPGDSTRNLDETTRLWLLSFIFSHSSWPLLRARQRAIAKTIITTRPIIPPVT